MASLFQSPEWEKFKLETGWQKSWRVFEILILEKKIPFFGSMLYSPMVTREQTKMATQKIFIEQINKIKNETGSIFYRLESADESDSDINLGKSGYAKSFEEMQPEHTLILDINKSEEDILSEMKQKGRYNIKVAEKHKVEVKEGTVDDFFKLYEETAKRQKITYRKKEYFQKLIDNLGEKEYVKVFIASVRAEGNPNDEIRNPKQFQNSNNHNSKVSDLENSDLDIVSNLEISASSFLPLASAIVTFYDKKAIYLFGGSSEKMRGAMAPYKLHFEIIKETKSRGCNEYDFFGIAPNDDEKHKWSGVTRFKKQFGGREESILGSWDLIFSPTKYKLFKLAEKVRRK